jgi:hypothetical protein
VKFNDTVEVPQDSRHEEVLPIVWITLLIEVDNKKAGGT